jgi:hypothetical protein
MFIECESSVAHPVRSDMFGKRLYVREKKRGVIDIASLTGCVETAASLQRFHP